MLGDAIELRFLLGPVVEGLGYELVHVTVGGKKTKTLQMFIDAPGGITVEDCERVSKQVSDVLDVENVVAGEYLLEVSSPGLDRPLVKQEHFETGTGKGSFYSDAGPSFWPEKIHRITTRSSQRRRVGRGGWRVLRAAVQRYAKSKFDK